MLSELLAQKQSRSKNIPEEIKAPGVVHLGKNRNEMK